MLTWRNRLLLPDLGSPRRTGRNGPCIRQRRRLISFIGSHGHELRTDTTSLCRIIAPAFRNRQAHQSGFLMPRKRSIETDRHLSPVIRGNVSSGANMSPPRGGSMRQLRLIRFPFVMPYGCMAPAWPAPSRSSFQALLLPMFCFSASCWSCAMKLPKSSAMAGCRSAYTTDASR